MTHRFGARCAFVLSLLALKAGAQIPATSDSLSMPRPVPRPVFSGQALEFDFPGLEIGIAEYDEGPTGVTVFYFPKGVAAAVDVRGGAPATINTDPLRLAYTSTFVDAISFAGGSSYGLAAATGVADEIKTRSAAAGDWGNIATVAGAIIFDLGGRRFNTITPDYELGKVALRNARPSRFLQGSRGAGRFTTQGGFYGDSARQHSGQGGAFRQVGTTKIAVFTIVNALGSVVDRDGRLVRCGRQPRAECGTIAERSARTVTRISEAAARRVSSVDAPRDVTENTTLTLVVTNQKLPAWALQRLAVQVHSSMGRAIQPFGTESDGDVLFAVTTDEVENAALTARDLGFIASELAWDAVLASVPELPAPYAGAPVRVDVANLDAYAGQYELSSTARVVVRRDGQRLLLEAAAGAGIYVPRGASLEMIPVSQSEFILQNARGDRLRFQRDAAGRVTGFTLNPDGWPVRALKR